MKYLLLFIKLFVCQYIYGQEYDSVIIEKDSIDENNQVFKVGNFYTYDYEIIEKGKSYKLKKNNKDESEWLKIENDFKYIEKIYLLITVPTIDEGRTNENQTEIAYYQSPIYNTYDMTGVVDNSFNIWIHPIRSGFFKSLETCPFPYVLKPLKIGMVWDDKMLIGDHWSNQIWGEWKGGLLMKYKIIGREKIKTKLGKIDCYIIESMAISDIGTSLLKFYFSEKYGFVRLEYELMTGLKVNLYLVDFQKNQEFNDGGTIMMTEKIIK